MPSSCGDIYTPHVPQPRGSTLDENPPKTPSGYICKALVSVDPPQASVVVTIMYRFQTLPKGYTLNHKAMNTFIPPVHFMLRSTISINIPSNDHHPEQEDCPYDLKGKGSVPGITYVLQLQVGESIQICTTCRVIHNIGVAIRIHG